MLGDERSVERAAAAELAGESTWFEVSRERYWEALEVCPPRWFRGGFYRGEAGDRQAFVETFGRYFTRCVAPDKLQIALTELIAALGDQRPTRAE